MIIKQLYLNLSTIKTTDIYLISVAFKVTILLKLHYFNLTSQT